MTDNTPIRCIGDHPPRDGRDWECQCARCGSSCELVECHECDENGFVDHECGDDTCCCAHPEPNVVCDTCGGFGGWYTCLSSPDYCQGNPLEGREKIARGTIEWFADS